MFKIPAFPLHSGRSKTRLLLWMSDVFVLLKPFFLSWWGRFALFQIPDQDFFFFFFLQAEASFVSLLFVLLAGFHMDELQSKSPVILPNVWVKNLFCWNWNKLRILLKIWGGNEGTPPRTSGPLETIRKWTAARTGHFRKRWSFPKDGFSWTEILEDHQIHAVEFLREENRSVPRKPKRAQGKHANSTQKGRITRFN